MRPIYQECLDCLDHPQIDFSMAEVNSKKRKRVSKNKKKNWRKTDISEVEEYLEDQRLQERTGGIVADKPDEALFFIDKETKEDEEVPAKRSKKEPKPLRCFANLEPDPRIKASSKSVKRTAHTYEKRKSIRVKEREAKGVVTVTAKKASAQRKKANAIRKQEARVKTLPDTKYDLWGNDGGEEIKAPAVDEYHQRITKKLRIKKPARTFKKPSGLPAVEIAHPGASYNPSYDDHLELLTIAHEVEVIKDKEERRILRSLDEKFPSKHEAPTQQTWMQEMSAGLYEDASDNEDVGDVTKISNNPPVRRENKKTVTQRNKEKKHRELQEKRKKDKESRIKGTEIFRLKSFKKDVTEREKRMAEKAKRKAELKEKNKDNPKVLGKLKYEAPDIEVKLGDELRGSLRLLKPEGNLLEDRFHSLQKRNIIEPRLRAKYKKTYKDKAFEKAGHREITL